MMPPQNGYIHNNYNYNVKAYNNLNNNNNINNNLYNQNSINIINNNMDYSSQNQKALSRPNININNNNQNQINMINNNSNNQKVKCTCTKTGCKKKYCYCFSKGILCDGCECKNCQNCIQGSYPTPIIQNLSKDENNIQNEEYNNKEEIQISKPQRVICNCTKSNCMKKYCECFKQGFNCNSLCRCLDCKNKIYISNLSDFTENKNINNTNTNYNINSNFKDNNNNNNNNSFLSNDLINNNNFYNYALHNNISNNIINNNIINNPSYIPETFGKSVDYSNPINFQPEAFGIYIKKEKLKIDIRKLNLNEENKDLKNNIINSNKTINKNNFSEINETPKFSNKKRLRAKNENSTSVRTCPTTNSSNKLKKAVHVVNKNIKKKKLQLS